jgi:hypothetical protein
MLQDFHPHSRRTRVWARRGIALDEGGMLVLKPALIYRLRGLVAFLFGCAVTLYFSLFFILAKSLAIILGLGVFWAMGAVLLWVGLAMLFDPWMIRLCRPSGTIEVIERKAFPLLGKRRLIALEQVESILLRQTGAGGAFGGGPSYVLELLLHDGETIEIDRVAAVVKEALQSVAERIREVTGKPIVEEKSEVKEE